MKESTRHWIAYKLVCLAHRLHDATFKEIIKIVDRDGETVIEWEIGGDDYACGVLSQFGHSQFGAYHAVWDEFPQDGEKEQQ